MQLSLFVTIGILLHAAGQCHSQPLPSAFQPAGHQLPPETGIIAPRADVTIISSHYEILPNSRYMYRYELSDGTIRFEVGYVRHINGAPFTTVSEGFYIYKTPEGLNVKLSYLADHNGVKIVDYYIGKDAVEENPWLINRGVVGK